MIPLHGNIGLLTADEFPLAEALINKQYAWRGYGNDHLLPTSQSYTFGIVEAERVLGTVTLRTGELAAEALFAQELGTVGLFPVEMTRLAFDLEGDSLQTMAQLYHCIFIFGKERLSATDLVIEVNPRHIRFYERMLGFKKLGTMKINPSVEAPSQLMVLRVHEISSKIFNAGRSLYRFFLTPDEAHEVKLRCDSIPSR